LLISTPRIISLRLRDISSSETLKVTLRNQALLPSSLSLIFSKKLRFLDRWLRNNLCDLECTRGKLCDLLSRYPTEMRDGSRSTRFARWRDRIANLSRVLCVYARTSLDSAYRWPAYSGLVSKVRPLHRHDVDTHLCLPSCVDAIRVHVRETCSNDVGQE